MTRQTFEPTQQQNEIIGLAGCAFIRACPGAGKTKVMAERARHLFKTMSPGRGVAFVSFTQAAVFELEKRLKQEGIFPSPMFPNFIGTFDSFVWLFLIAPFGITGINARPRLIADIADLPVTPFSGAHSLPLFCFHPLTHEINEYAAKLKGFDPTAKPSKQLRAYSTAAKNTRDNLRARGLLGFDDARFVALDRLEDATLAARIAAALAGRFREVIVDEAQDCNPDDLKIISWLRNAGLPVKVVCDPHQAIFEFRGGVTDHLFTFADTFEAGERKEMTGNFRSTPNICKAISQLRPPASRGTPDNPLGPFKLETTPVHILSYAGAGVSSAIGGKFSELLSQSAIDLSLSPVIAATKASGAAACGQNRANGRRDRTFRFVEAVMDFHFSSEFSEMKAALDTAHEILLEFEGRLSGTSYHRYLADNDINPTSWRPRVIAILRELRFDPEKYSDARAWHADAKSVLEGKLTIDDGQSISQKLRWNPAIDDILVAVPGETAMPRTIHSVKGMEFPAVCVVTTSSTLKSILDFLETGQPTDKAEDARKLYVAASRAQRLLVVAAPKSQAARLREHLSVQGAVVTIEDI